MYGTGFMAVAARETEERVRKEERQASEKAKLAAEKAKLAAVQLEKRTLMMRSWKAGLPIAIIEMITEVKREDVEKLIAAFEKVSGEHRLRRAVVVCALEQQHPGNGQDNQCRQCKYIHCRLRLFLNQGLDSKVQDDGIQEHQEADHGDGFDASASSFDDVVVGHF